MKFAFKFSLAVKIVGANGLQGVDCHASLAMTVLFAFFGYEICIFMYKFISKNATLSRSGLFRLCATKSRNDGLLKFAYFIKW